MRQTDDDEWEHFPPINYRHQMAPRQQWIAPQRAFWDGRLPPIADSRQTRNHGNHHANLEGTLDWVYQTLDQAMHAINGGRYRHGDGGYYDNGANVVIINL
jgi:hypothetical protein